MIYGLLNNNVDLNILIVTLIVICISSVYCQRGFSIMNIIKFWLRASLRVGFLMVLQFSQWSVAYAC